MQGRVIKLISNKWTVLIGDKLLECSCIGKFKYLKKSPLVGDLVCVDVDNRIINNIMPRRNELVRPPIANVDQALILTSCTEPSFSSNLLDKMLVIIEYNNIEPIICFTKYDLLKDTTYIDGIINYYRKIGYKVFINNDLDTIKKTLKGKVSVLTGQTGVGKSSLLNHLKEDLNLSTSEISKALGRGKHTTRHVELLEIENALVADTPGFSSIDFIGMNKNDIKDNFKEFYENQEKCKYKDCMHIKEDGCHIKKLCNENIILNTRYENYKKFIEQIEKDKR